jgi:hypothetical protein
VRGSDVSVLMRFPPVGFKLPMEDHNTQEGGEFPRDFAIMPPGCSG